MIGVDSSALETIVRAAGKLILDVYRKAHMQMHEKSPMNLVTEADIASENLLKKELENLLPGSAILAEESGAQGSGDYCWVIDPLDGTNNFGHHIGYFCISVALTYKGTVVQGVVYQPLLDEFFYAKAGEGASLNGKPIKVLQHENYSPVICFTYTDAHGYKNLLDKIPFPYTFRHLGAAALDLAYVACGRIDGMISEKLYWWDIAAGSLLVQEAGGVVVDSAGARITKDAKSCLAMTPQLYRSLKDILKS